MIKVSPKILKSNTKVVKEIDLEVIRLLNQGQREARNLMESLKIDFTKLIENLLKVPLDQDDKEQLSLPYGIVHRMRSAALILNKQGIDFKVLARHSSDTVRGWAAFQIAYLPNLSLEERFEFIKPLADDSHFGVREWAWLALRPFCLTELSSVINLLQPWVTDVSANIRRFACELTRPRGVWCAHINDLKKHPEQALILLDSLKQDNSRYVQNSLANWLNDVSKTNKKWVVKLCQQWLAECPAPATQYICNRAQRTIRKKQIALQEIGNNE